MRSINTVVVCSLFLALPFTSVFAINGVFTLPLLIILFAILLFFVELPLLKVQFSTDIISPILILFLCFALFTSIVNNSIEFSGKSINHTFAYIFVFGVNYLLLSVVLKSLQYSRKAIFSTLVFGVFLTCIVGLVEFLCKNFFSYPFDQLLPRADVEVYDPTVMGEYIRIRSFVEESGHLSLFIEIFFPICYYLIKSKSVHGVFQTKSFQISFYAVCTLAFFLTFSTAGFAIVILAFSICFLPRALLRKFLRPSYHRARSILKLAGSLILLISFLMVFSSEVSDFLTILNEVLFGKLSAGSADDRRDRIGAGIELFNSTDLLHKLIGYGPGAYEKLGIESIVSLYVTFLIEVGYIGLFIFIMFLTALFIRVYFIKDFFKRRIFLFVIICSTIHFFAISNYWYPWFWVSIILIEIIPNRVKGV